MKFTGIALLAYYAMVATASGESPNDPIALTANNKPLTIHRIGRTKVWWAGAAENDKQRKDFYVQNGKLYITEGGGQHAVLRPGGGSVVFSNKQRAATGFEINNYTVTSDSVEIYLCTKEDATEILAFYGPSDTVPATCVPAQLEAVKSG